MIDWVKDALIFWGLQCRRIEYGGIQYDTPEGEKKWHVDGWPKRSIQGKSKDEGEGAGHTAAGQHFEEVLTGDALKVWRALFDAPEALRDLAWVHYVVPKQILATKQKIAHLGYPYPKAYYATMGKLHTWVAARWDVPRGTNNGNNVASEYL